MMACHTQRKGYRMSNKPKSIEELLRECDAATNAAVEAAMSCRALYNLICIEVNTMQHKNRMPKPSAKLYDIKAERAKKLPPAPCEGE